MPGTPLYVQPFDHFPTRCAHEARWTALAQAIAAERVQIPADPAALQPAAVPGELIVIGSGIEAVGFTTADEICIREADHVFFCVADPATSVWIKALRPDAYDLYVLYDDTKRRYLTYMQMTEAILHFVRKGQKVVAIYYGHPGIFVLSSHRAVRIARREGHSAVMRAAVSALDTLCADLSIDPSQPGLMTFEATDMLIRRRRPDPSLHVVLWQVGLIGELGYRRQGFLNRNFSVLLDYLEDLYGPDKTVINYVGSRYPGIPPLTAAHTITALRDPDIQATVTGISTFYLAPSEAVPADPAMLEALGLLPPGQTPKASPSPLRDIEGYGPREMQAFEDFAHFRVPRSYHWQEDTAAARFILALREDGALRRLYAHAPAAGVAAWPAANLSWRERTLLARRDAGAMQLAAKGDLLRDDQQAERLLRMLLTSTSAARVLLRRVRRAAPDGTAGVLTRWSATHDYHGDWSTMPAMLQRTLRQVLYPWNGLYLDAQRQYSLFLLGRPGSPASNRVYFNGQLLTGVRYEQGTMQWRAEAGNPSSGQLQVDISPRHARRLLGAIWPAGETLASHHRLTVLEHLLPTGAPCAALPGSSCDTEAGVLTPFHGDYVVRVVPQNASANLVHLVFDETGVVIQGQAAKTSVSRGVSFTWHDGPGCLAEGEATPVLDPITLKPMLFGAGHTAGRRGALALVGMVPVDDGEARVLAAQPRFAMPDWAWVHVVAIAAEASRKGGLFLWHSWEKAAANLRRLGAVLREARL